MLDRSGLPGWLRALLAGLTVLASLLHLSRSPAAGGLGAEAWRAAAYALPGSAQPHAGHAGPGALAREPQEPGCPQRYAETAAGYTGHGGHHQAAHCPFCLTSAFALQAGLVWLAQGPPDALPQFIRGAESRVVMATRHADARAPPFES